MVVLYDLKMASHTDANKPKSSVALLNSTYSTLISSDRSEIEVFPITVIINITSLFQIQMKFILIIKKLTIKFKFKISDLVSNYNGTHWIDNEVQGKLVAISKIVKTDDMQYEKVLNIYVYKCKSRKNKKTKKKQNTSTNFSYNKTVCDCGWKRWNHDIGEEHLPHQYD